MKKILLSIFVLIGTYSLSFGQDSQSKKPESGRAEIYSPWEFEGTKPKPNAALHAKSCFDLVRLEQRCGGIQAMSYGDRFGENWDIFDIVGSPD